MQRKKGEIVPREEIPWLKNDQVIECETCLPYPYVHYPPRISGAFFGFQENQNSPLYFCSCQKEGIEQVLSSDGTINKNAFPRIIGDLCSFDFRYKETLCHICSQTPPTYAYAPKKNKKRTKKREPFFFVRFILGSYSSTLHLISDCL